MSVRRPLSRVLLGGALLGGGALAVAGGLALRGPGLIGVGLAATLAGCTAAGIAREAPSRGSALEAAVWAAGWTVGAVLVVAGLSTVAGDGVAVVAVAGAVAAFLVLRLVRGRDSRSAHRGTVRPQQSGGEVVRLPTTTGQAPPSGEDPVWSGRLVLPVTALATRALGDEWLRTTAALSGPLNPAARQALVARRGETLDELERRDPDGFGRWLAAGPAAGSDPADFVRGGPAHRGPVADTDAA